MARVGEIMDEVKSVTDADFDNAINAAQKAEEGIKQKERNHAEETTKAKERNATIHAEQLLKRTQKKLEERNKTAVQCQGRKRHWQIRVGFSQSILI